MRRAHLASAVLLPLILAADSAADRAAKVRARYADAVQKAADAYWHQKLTADHAYVDGLQSQLRTSTGNAELKAECDAARAELDADAAEAKAHSPLTTMAAATAQLKAAERKANMTPAVEKAIGEHRLLAGMTLDQANEAMGVDGKGAGSDANGQQYEWTLSHVAPLQGGAVVGGEDAGSAGAERLGGTLDMKNRPRIVDAVWSGRFEGGRLVSFTRAQ